jgi:hypothetical protein
MAQDDKRRGQGDPDDDESLEPLKDQVAKEVGVDPDRYGGNVPAKQWGALGGHMVKRLIEKGKDALADDDNDEEPSNQGER